MVVRKQEEEVFVSEMERKKLSLLYRAWRKTGKQLSGRIVMITKS